MDEAELARAVAADLGPDIAAEVEREIAGVASRDGAPRAFSTDDKSAQAGFLVAGARLAVMLWRQQRERAALLLDLATGIEQRPELAARLHPELRLALTARLLDRLVPEQSATRGSPGDPRIERQRWLGEWIGPEPSRAVTRPILQPFADMDFYALFQPVYWARPPFARNDLPRNLTVPKGFVTDLATVPRLFWQALPPSGRYGPAAIIHDWLYWQQATTREIADTIFLVVMEELDVTVATRRSMWASVRIFGGPAWEQNARERRAGEGRVLRTMPDSIKTTWAEWRQRPEVFEKSRMFG